MTEAEYFCPMCRSESVIPIYHGLGPIEMEELIFRKLVHPSGKFNEAVKSPHLHCRDCKHEWGESTDLLQKVVRETPMLTESERFQIYRRTLYQCVVLCNCEEETTNRRCRISKTARRNECSLEWQSLWKTSI